MKKRIVSVFVVFLCLTACKPTNEEMSEFGQQLLKETLKDPDSAKLESTFKESGAGEGYVCGTVNAKNSYGGYVGKKPFYVYLLVEDKKVKEHGPVVVINDNDAKAADNYRLFCQ